MKSMDYKSKAEEVESFWKNVWAQYKMPIILVLMALIVLLCFNLGQKHSEVTKEPTMHTVSDTSPKEIQKYFHMSDGEAKDVSHRIEVAKTQAPTYRYITYTQDAADSKAHDYAKQQHADNVVKTTKDITPADRKAGDPEVVENNYYAINMAKKHDIKVGVAVIDDKTAAEVSYRNRDIEYSVYTDGHNVSGGSVQVTVAKW
jgi:hypothetical protein